MIIKMKKQKKKNPGGRRSSRKPTDAVATLSTSRFVKRKKFGSPTGSSEIQYKNDTDKNRRLVRWDTHAEAEGRIEPSRNW